MTEPTPPTWPHEPVAPGWVRTPESRYYFWEPETHSWRAASVLVIGKLVDELRAALDAEKWRAEQAARERDAALLTCQLWRDRAQALRKQLQRCVSLIPPVKFASLVREVRYLLAATAPPEATEATGR